MLRHQIPDERQTDAETFGDTARFPYKGIENALEHVLTDPNAGVSHGHDGDASFLPRIDRDLGSLRRVPRRIRQEVLEHLLQPALVAVDPQRWSRRDHCLETLLPLD